MAIKKISISKIVSDENIMPREHINHIYINNLVDDLETGAKFPPVDLFFNGKQYFIADGFHRLEVFKISGHNKIMSTVRKGNRRDALSFSCGVNSEHGLRRTNKDKKKAVFKMLNDSEWGTWSDGKIAQHCIVTQQFVSKLRRELTQNGCESSSKRLGADGRTIDTDNIGKKGPNSEDPQTTKSVSITVNMDDLPPKASAKKKSTESDDGSGGDDTEIPSSPIDYTTVLAEAHKLIKDFEAALCNFKKALPSKSNSNSLSEIDFSVYLDRISQSMTKLFVFCSKTLTIGK